MANGSLTLEKMLEAIKALPAPINSKPHSDLFSPRNFPLEFGGMKVIEHKPFPKLQVRSHVEMSDEFREEMNTWLLNMFGYQEAMIKPHEFIISREYNMIIARPEGIALLRNSIT